MKTIIFTFLTFLIFSCQSKEIPGENNEVVFSGEILNNSDTSARLFLYLINDKIIIDSANYEFAIELDRPYLLNMRLAKELLSCYVMPGDSVQIDFDKSDFEKTLTFSGDHSLENMVLRNYQNLLDSLTDDRSSLYSLVEEAFILKMDSIKNQLNGLLVDFYDRHPDIDPRFTKLMEAEINYNHVSMLKRYKRSYIRYTGDSSYVESEKFSQLKAPLAFDDADLIGSNNFRDELDNALFKLASEKVGEDGDLENALNEVLSAGLDSVFANEEIREYVRFIGNCASVNWFDFDKAMVNAKSFLESSDNLVYTNFLNKNIKKWDRLRKGNPAPDFTYPDINNLKHSLSDYKGQYVYLDIWATWCKPCVAEHPALAELEKKYHDNPDIVFMAVSVDRNRDAWEKMVTKKKLGGVQLIKEGDHDSLDEDYIMSGIPRFVLIDKEGNLINAKAPRPSSDKMKKILEDLLDDSSELLGYNE